MDNEIQDKKDLQQVKKNWGLLRVLLFAFVIFFVLRLFFPQLLSLVVVGPIVLGIPLLFMLVMGVGVLVAVFFTIAGLFLCGIILLAILLLFASIFASSWPVVTIAVICIIMLLLSRNKKGLDDEK